MDSSACELGLDRGLRPGRSVLSTCRFVDVAAERRLGRPAQRCSRPTLPASWMTQSALVTPASFICSPAA